MTRKPKHPITAFITFFLITIALNMLFFLPLSKAIANEKILNHLNLEDLKTQLLKDSVFLSKMKEKIVPIISDKDVQKIIRDYLLNNPEIMSRMQLMLKERLKKQAEIISNFEKEIFHSPHDAILGNPRGRIVLVDFFDYNCKYCKLSHSRVANLIKEYPNLRVIIKDLPILGSDSVAAHSVSYAFRKEFPEKYSQFYEALLTNQDRANETNAIKIAVSLGADEKKLKNAIADPSLQNFFEENKKIASALNITGIPFYIVGNKILIGAVSEDILKEAIRNIQ
ncbi:DsbA family protein [Bartonella sp. B41]